MHSFKTKKTIIIIKIKIKICDTKFYNLKLLGNPNTLYASQISSFQAPSPEKCSYRKLLQLKKPSLLSLQKLKISLIWSIFTLFKVFFSRTMVKKWGKNAYTQILKWYISIPTGFFKVSGSFNYRKKCSNFLFSFYFLKLLVTILLFTNTSACTKIALCSRNNKMLPSWPIALQDMTSHSKIKFSWFRPYHIQCRLMFSITFTLNTK